MYKQNLVLNNLQCLMWNKTKQNQTIHIYIYIYFTPNKYIHTYICA